MLVGKPEKKQPLEWYRRRWNDHIKLNLKEVGCEDVDWIHLAQHNVQWRALVNWVPQNAANLFN